MFIFTKKSKVLFSQFIKKVSSWYFDRRYHQLQVTLSQFSDIQKKTITKIISKNKNCSYLQSYQCQTIDDLPLVHYDEIEPYVTRMLNGQERVLTNNKIHFFSKSSGTTSRSKYIPISKDFMYHCNYRAGLDLVALYSHANPNSAIYLGKNFGLTGSVHPYGKKMVGDISALMAYVLPFYFKYFKVPKNNIALISPWDEKLEGYVKTLPGEDLRWLAGVPSWMIIVLEKLSEHTQKTVSQLFPNLEVFFYGGVHIGPFKDKLNKIFDHNVMLWQTYNASEGFFAIQASDEDQAMVLMPHYGIYYEFIPRDQIHIENPTIITSNEIRVGEVYELIITTTSGLYRYRIGDLVQVVSIDPIKIEVYGRTKSFINICGEELMVHNVESALILLKTKLSFEINEYTIAPNKIEEAYHHEWWIAFDQMPDDMDEFVNELDKILRDINSDYDAKRYQDLLLKSLKVKVLQKDVFEKWVVAHRTQNVQVKIPRLSNDRKIVEELSKF